MRTRNHARTSIFVYVFSLSILAVAWGRPYLFPSMQEEGMFFGLFALSFAWFLPVLRSTRGQQKLAEHRDRILQDAIKRKVKEDSTESAVA